MQMQRDICDEHGLKIVLTYTNPERMTTNTEEVIRDHRILGCKNIGMMAPKCQTATWINQFAKDYIEPAKKMRGAGMLLMYHNRNIECTKLSDGRELLDVPLEQMPAGLMGFTLDVCWA